MLGFSGIAAVWSWRRLEPTDPLTGVAGLSRTDTELEVAVASPTRTRAWQAASA